MSSIFHRWLRRQMSRTGIVQDDPLAPGVPVHWLDVTPRESQDKPCSVRSLEVHARVSGLYAEVTQTLVIHNPNQRPISAPLTIPMPDRAVVCGYALDIDGQMIDGVVATKEKARVAFETEQRRGADPGLVEAVRGNVYRTRVYPVPAGGTRTISLRYVTPLMLEGARSATLDLPMPAEHLDRRTLCVEVETLDAPSPVISGIGDALMSEARGFWKAEAEEHNLTPSEPVRIALPELPSSFVMLERDGEGTVWFAASEEIALDETQEPATITSLTVLWDASGSRAGADHGAELDLLHGWCTKTTVKDLKLVVFGDCVQEVQDFSSARELVDHIRALHYDGGTDFAALARALHDLPRACAGIAQGSACVLFSDGVDTLSDEPFVLPEGCDALAVVTGTERDAETLRQACGGVAMDLALVPHKLEDLARVLDRTSPARILDVRGTGFADLCDTGTPEGARRAVIGRLSAEEAQVTLGIGGQELTLRAEDAREGTVLARAWAARRVALLSPRASDFEEELLSLGRRFGVASPATSLIVLETLDQWLRHDIEPPKSWASMHERWASRKAGEMRLSSPQAEKDRHRSDLASAWREVMQWWETDFEKLEEKRRAEEARQEAERRAMGASPVERDGGITCPTCGSTVSSRMLFCPACGTPIQGAVSAVGRPESPVSGLRRAIFAEAAEEDALTDFADALPDAMPMPTAAPRVRLASASAAPMAMAAAAPAARASMDASDRGGAPTPSVAPEAAVHIRAWMPDTPYLMQLDKAWDRGIEAARETYHEQRSTYANAPSFFLDCAGWFLAHDDGDFGVRVLTNLAEMRIEDAALLRVLGWRLREAGKLELALVVLRRVLRMRREEAQGHRDVALVLSELAREAYAADDEDGARAFAEEAGELYRTCALTPWQRRSRAMGLFAVEEYNVLRAWADARAWKVAPELPSLGNDLEGVPVCDLRITLAWDADETDVDIHVTEPGGEEAYYAHRRTTYGGRVSEDITDGYGPELYEIRRAQQGTYLIRAHYYASHQQAIFGPATCTLTVYTDWGRDAQSQQITTTRLDKQKEMVRVGTASYGKVAIAEAETERQDAPVVRSVVLGMSPDGVREILGDPDEKSSAASREFEEWSWRRAGQSWLIVYFKDGIVARVLERMPWGEETILAQ